MRCGRLFVRLIPLVVLAGPLRSQTAEGGWLDRGRLTPAALTMLRALAAAATDGLSSSDYAVQSIDSLRAASALGDADAAGELERRLTAAATRYVHDLRSGRTAVTPDRLAGPAGGEWSPALALADAVRGDSIPRMLAAARPPFAQYARLAHALDAYRRLAEKRAPRLSRVPVHAGDRLPEAGDLARFLMALGDLDSAAVPGQDATYSAALAEGVRSFQRRHALPDDGVITPATATALAVPMAWRIRQLELAMERLRLLPRFGSERFIVVNVPAFALFAFDSAGDDGGAALELRVIAGAATDRRTPTLVERLRYVEFNPYWNVPPSILQQEILPRIRRDDGYLVSNDMEIVGPSGRVLGQSPTPELIEALDRGSARVRQRPGAKNALGALKLIFPNESNIYIHGTPTPGLFKLPRRDLSHGCIRVEDPMTLAEWALRGEPGWDADAVARAIQGRRTVRVPVSELVPVIIYYTTAIVRPEGKVHFYNDIYHADEDLDAAMNRPR